MGGRHYFLTWSTAGWQAACLARDAIEWRLADSPADSTGAPTPDGAKAVLEELGYRGEPVCLGLPSRCVLTAPISTDGLPRQDRHAAMLYRLEEQLPVDAEHLAAAFLPPAGTSALGLAAETTVIAPLIEALSRAGVHVASVCPAALLAAWSATNGATSPLYCVIDGADGVDVLRVENGQPTAWSWSADQPDDLARCLRAALLAAPPGAEPPAAIVVADVECGGNDAAVDCRPGAPSSQSGVTAAALHSALGDVDWPLYRVVEEVFDQLHVRRYDKPPGDAAAHAAAQVLAGQPAGWVDLAGPLGLAHAWQRLKTPLTTATALAAVLLLLLIGGFLWKARQYAAIAQDAHQQQEQAFRQAFPNRPVPLSIRGYLASELARASAAPGAGAGVPAWPTALDTLRRLTSALPPEVRLRIGELRLGEQDLFVAGQSRTHADAEAVARALQAAGFICEPPRTEQLAAGGVSFTLAGSPGSVDKPAAVWRAGP